MNLSDAIGHASTIFMPEFLFGADEAMLMGERAANEEAIHLLVEEYFANPNPGFEFDLVIELADRNRSLCDMMGPESVQADRSHNLANNLGDDDILHGVAALQHRSVAKVAQEVEGMNATKGVLYGSKPAKGTFVGIDIETTSTSPDRGYIVNVGWEVMELAEGAEPADATSLFCGLPDQYEETGVPLSEIHKITWQDVGGKLPFREDKELQKRLLKVLKSHPFMRITPPSRTAGSCCTWMATPRRAKPARSSPSTRRTSAARSTPRCASFRGKPSPQAWRPGLSAAASLPPTRKNATWAWMTPT